MMKQDAKVIKDMLDSGNMKFIDLPKDDQITLLRGMSVSEGSDFYKTFTDEGKKVADKLAEEIWGRFVYSGTNQYLGGLFTGNESAK